MQVKRRVLMDRGIQHLQCDKHASREDFAISSGHISWWLRAVTCFERDCR